MSWGLCAVLATAACGETPARLESTRLAAVGPTDTRIPDCASVRLIAREPRGVPLQKGRAAGSTVVLARYGERTVAYIADEDARQLRVVDLDEREEVAATDLGGRPAQLLVAADGRVFASLSDRNEVMVLEPAGRHANAGLDAVCRVKTPAEPVGLALTADGATLLLASRWGQALTGYDVNSMKRRFTTSLPRDPHSVVVGADGLAYVSHVVGGHMSVVDPREPQKPRTLTLGDEQVDSFGTDGKPETRVRTGGHGFAIVAGEHETLMPVLLTHAGDTEVQTAISGYGSSSNRVMELAVARVLPATNPEAEMVHTARFSPVECLPRAALWDDSRTLLIACAGADVVSFHRVMFGHGGEVGSVRVGAGPTGMALESEFHRLVVWSQFDAALSVMTVDHDRSSSLVANEPETIRLEPRGAPAELAALGRKLFHAAGDTRVSADGRTCASCHPSGRDDGLTWATLEGPRQTPMLLARLDGTAPYDWNGKKHDLHAHLRRTLRRLSGTGLSARERQALFAYLDTLEAPVTNEPHDATTRRGAQIFADAATGCASCHTGAPLTDGLSHDVDTLARGDKLREFDTPSLRFVGQSAPYFHDGRYPTLLAMLTDEQMHMGTTAHLSQGELNALVAYLQTL
jgi:mono/diheme cytochrome c family protein